MNAIQAFMQSVGLDAALNPDYAPPKPWREQFPQEAAFIEAYTGTSSFFQSLKAQFERSGYLTEKQTACITREVSRNQSPTPNNATKPVTQSFTLKVGQEIILSKGIAEKFTPHAFNGVHMGFKVVAVERETERAYLATLELAAIRTRHCCVCGITLTNPESIAIGIGPICAERHGIDHAMGTMDMLANRLRGYAPISGWLPKVSIKERLG